MLDMRDASRKPDDEVIFYDAMLYVISYDREFTCDQIVLVPEYDIPLSLADIRKIYPYVEMLIVEDFLHTKVYSYGNHAGEGWELRGEVIGFA